MTSYWIIKVRLTLWHKGKRELVRGSANECATVGGTRNPTARFIQLDTLMLVDVREETGAIWPFLVSVQCLYATLMTSETC